VQETLHEIPQPPDLLLLAGHLRVVALHRSDDLRYLAGRPASVTYKLGLN